MAQDKSLPPRVIVESDICNAPMSASNKELAMVHFRRLRAVLDSEGNNDAGVTGKQSAREQLARMTLVYRDYMAAYARCQIDVECESMATDMVEASLFLAGRHGRWSEAVVPNNLSGRDAQVAVLSK